MDAFSWLKMVLCSIPGCSATYGGKTKVALYGLPAVITTQCDLTQELSTQRRELWLSRINREDLFSKKLTRDVKVCNRHFISGKPSKLFEHKDPDWAPSINLVHVKHPRNRSKRILQNKTVVRGLKRNIKSSETPNSSHPHSLLKIKQETPNEQKIKEEPFLTEQLGDIFSVEIKNEVYSDSEDMKDPLFIHEPDLACQTDLTGVQITAFEVRNVELRRENEELQSRCEVLEKENAALRAEVCQLQLDLKKHSLEKD